MSLKILFLFIRWIFFIPVSLIVAFILSGFAEVSMRILCNLALFDWIGGCDYEEGKDRSFIAELVMVVSFIYSCYYIVPKYKKQITSTLTLLVGLAYIVLEFYLYLNGFNYSWNIIEVGLLTVGFGVYMIYTPASNRLNDDSDEKA